MPDCQRLFTDPTQRIPTLSSTSLIDYFIVRLTLRKPPKLLRHYGTTHGHAVPFVLAYLAQTEWTFIQSTGRPKPARPSHAFDMANFISFECFVFKPSPNPPRGFLFTLLEKPRVSPRKLRCSREI